MQLTIDSNDTLPGVLQAVGGMYGVKLVVDPSGAPSNSTAAATPRPSRSSSSNPVSGGGGRRGTRAATPTADAGAIRRWVQDSGLMVTPRGRIPDSVVEAFNAAH